MHDNLTGLPNRELFLDRLEAAIRLARADTATRPSVLHPRHRPLQAGQRRFGLAVGDSILLTIARRLAAPAQAAGHAGAALRRPVRLLLLSENQPERIAAFAESVRRTLRAPITLGEKEIFLTASIGIAVADSQPHRREEMIKDAEIGMYHAKRLGGDRIEAFRRPCARARPTG